MKPKDVEFVKVAIAEADRYRTFGPAPVKRLLSLLLESEAMREKVGFYMGHSDEALFGCCKCSKRHLRREMIAQLYTDHDPILRIFDGLKMLADIELDWIPPPIFAPRGYRPEKDATITGAKKALHRMGLQVKSKWAKREWGYEARVSFRRP